VATSIADKSVPLPYVTSMLQGFERLQMYAMLDDLLLPPDCNNG